MMLTKGIFPALLTPFTPDGALSKQGLSDLIEYNLSKGVTGFYVTGSTAEVFLLSDEERLEVMKSVAELTQGRCQLIAHVGAISTGKATEFAKQAETLGYDAVSAVAPFYYQFPVSAIQKYYFDIVNSTSLPLLIYHFPAFSGVSLSMRDFDELLKHPRIIGVKNTSSDYFALEKMKAHHPDKIIFNGYDETFLAGLAMGADGAIGSTFNFMAEKFIQIMQAFAAGDLPRAQQLQATANRIIEALVGVGVMQGEKAILEALGIQMGDCRPPFEALDEAKKAAFLEDVLPLLKEK